MGIFGTIMKAGMNHEERAALEAIEKMLANGEISKEEADRKREDLYAILKKTFGSDEQDEA